MASSFFGRRVRSTARVAVFAAASLCLADAAAAGPAATDLGVIPAAQPLHATVWLARKDEAGFQRALKAIYDPASSSFHHWMTPAQYNSYMPDQASLATVQDALVQSGLTIETIAADGRSIQVSAPAAAIARAFGSPVHSFQKAGKIFLATTARPTLAGTSGALIAAITGLGTPRTQPFALRQIDQSTGRPVARALSPTVVTGNAAGSPLNPYFTDNCYDGYTRQALETAEGDATFIGRRQVDGYFAAGGAGYGVCGYDATQLRAHYGLTGPVSRGLDGTGQTIGIVVAYGSPFILSDVNTYSSILSLPQLGASNFRILTPLGNTLTYDSGWSTETTIDVSMAHAIAPGAKIVLLVAPTNATEDLLNTFEYAVEHQLAQVVSMSFGEPEFGSDGSDEEAWGLVTAEAASYGIGVNVSTGDTGDNGAGTPVGAPSTPADSAYVTAVGGTTLALPTAEGRRDVGWGWQSTYPNTNRLVKTKLQVGAGEAIGAGGGESVYFGKPYWQDALPGSGRQTPDISAIADPLTGADLVLTVEDGDYLVQVVTVAGGTSVASPVFAGISAIANQRAGERIGQVAPLLPSLQGAAMTDIVPLTAQDPKMTATLDGKPLTTPDVTPDALALLAQGVDNIEQIFVVRPILSMTIFTYGLDTSLTTATGWDNVTGYGEPNGNAFLVALAKAAKGVQQ
jgi:subtilase family serine protease